MKNAATRGTAIPKVRMTAATFQVVPDLVKSICLVMKYYFPLAVTARRA